MNIIILNDVHWIYDMWFIVVQIFWSILDSSTIIEIGIEMMYA